MIQKLHIISLDIPYPPDYGGMIDVFYKLKALHKAGVEITLHCFQYGSRRPSAELNAYCKTVFYYKRKTGLKGLHYSLPYIISSRNDKALLTNLIQDDNPILFEGLHTTFFLSHPLLRNRVKLLRAHNIESDYYRQLAQNSPSVLKKLYYFLEANRLLVYENSMKDLSGIFAISEADKNNISGKYPSIPVTYLPAFHAYDEVTSMLGKGSYCLYHGNLSIAENIKSVQFLLKEIFNDIEIPLIIAGKNPTSEIMAAGSDTIKIIPNPSDAEMQTLIQQAHIHLLPSFQTTGMKLKLLHSLFAGRFVLVNDTSIESAMRDTIEIANQVPAFKAVIVKLMKTEFSETELENRKRIMEGYRNDRGAQIILNHSYL